MKSTHDVYIEGKRIRLDERQVIGKGGEADIYDIGQGRALKLYKAPEHPDLQTDAAAREAARRRIEEQQQKLRQFPTNLPGGVVAPQMPATADASGQRIVGYTVPLLKDTEVLLRFGDRVFRESGGIDHNAVIAIFRDLHETVTRIHQAGVVIGDFNDLNVLVRLNAGENEVRQAYLIDADSFQFGAFLCRTFTTRFVDPMLCDPQGSSLALDQPPTSGSDWYALGVMLMQCLLYVDPYGGLYKPKDKARRLPHGLRPLHRITVFHPEVCYPKPAIPLAVLPDDLLQWFQQVFERDCREPVARGLLDNMRWTACDTCGMQHAKLHCPSCFHAPPAAVTATITVRGTVTATRVFRTAGIILCATSEQGSLRTLFHENGRLKREDGSVVASCELDPQVRFGIQGDATLLGRQDQLFVIRAGQVTTKLSVETCNGRPVFAANRLHLYWAEAGQLLRDGTHGPEYIGDVLARQTSFWVGSDFGFGFYRAGNLSVAFVFDAKKGGINDSVRLPVLPGQLVDADCVFGADRCWFLTTFQESGQLINRCFAISRAGEVLAGAAAVQGDGSWLGSRLRGKFASVAFLLAPSDEGIVRVVPDGGNLAVTKTFPDTEPFVHGASQLLPAAAGLYVVGPNDIHLLKIQ